MKKHTNFLEEIESKIQKTNWYDVVLIIIIGIGLAIGIGETFIW